MRDTTIDESINLDIEFEEEPDEEITQEVDTIDRNIEPEQKPEEEIEVEPESDNQDETEEEKFHFLPKVIREIKELDGDIIQICPTLLWGNWRKKLRCKNVKKKSKAV